MTFRARPTTKPTTRRRGSRAEEGRRNLYMNIGFGLIVVVAVLLLVGAGAASWVDEHLAPVAKVNGVTITKDQLRERVKIENFQLGDIESRTREKVQAGHISAAQGQQVIQSLSQQRQQVSSTALEHEIDVELLLQLAAKRKATASAAAIDAQLVKDATTVESRHVFQIAIVPEVSAGATAATDAQVAAARTKAEGLLADLKGGKAWEDVVKTSGDATATANNGDLLFLDKGSTSPDAAFVDAAFALTAPGLTDVVKGSDGTFRIGRVTEIAPEQVDPDYTKRIADAGISLDAYKRGESAVVVRDLVQAQLLAEVVDAPSQQHEVSVIVLENNNGQAVAPGAVLVKHILYSPNHDPSTAKDLAADDPAWVKAKQEADDAVAKLKAGTATFAALAATSDDTGSGASNGFLPYFSQSDSSTSLDPAFAAAIFAPGLTPGQLLEPVKSAFGWHVIEFVTEADPITRANQLVTAASKPGADFAKLVADNSIDPSARKGGSLGWVAKYQLAPEQDAAISGLGAGELSVPVGASDGIRLFKVTNVEERKPDDAQVEILKSDAFSNWYAGVKADPKQTTIERLVSTSTPGA